MATKGNASSGSGGGLKASKMAAKGTISEKEVLTSRVCPVCNNRMRQNEISVEIAFRHSRKPGEPRRERIFKHIKNCKAA
jgi:hypothetical protein